MDTTTDTLVTASVDQHSPPVLEVVFCRVLAEDKAALRGLAEDRGMTINCFFGHMLETFIKAKRINEREQVRTSAMMQRIEQARSLRRESTGYLCK